MQFGKMFAKPIQLYLFNLMCMQWTAFARFLDQLSQSAAAVSARWLIVHELKIELFHVK